MCSFIIMSFVIQTNPVISYTPTIYDPYVSLVPLSTILVDPISVFYDPFKTAKTYEIVTPNYGHYFTYPDLNSDIKIQNSITKHDDGRAHVACFAHTQYAFI